MAVPADHRRWVAALALPAAVAVVVAGACASGGRQEPPRPRAGKPPPAAAVRVPTVVDLSRGRWELRMARTAGPGGWVPARVPGVFDPRPVRAGVLGTVGWYRLRFLAPPLPLGFSWALRFDQVKRSADVWFNGRHVGHRRDASLPFTVAALGLRPGQENLLVVKADNRRHAHKHEPWWNWGGITRGVWLVPRGPARLDPVALLPRLRRSGGRWHARVVLTGRLRNRARRPLPARINTSLASPGGTVSRSTRRVVLPAGGSRFVHFAVRVQGRPQLWMPGHPRLYRAVVRVMADGATAQLERSRIGLRSVRVEHGLLFVNGRRLSARGAAMTEYLPGDGAAIDGAGAAWLVGDLERLHADVTRMQELPSEQVLDRLDAAGILL
jgi:beta-galactosidase